MSRPARTHLDAVNAPSDNWALALHRYCRWERVKEKNKSVVEREFFAHRNLPQVYLEAHRQWKSVAELLHDGVLLRFETATPFLVGTGEKNVMETGLTLNWTYGVPMIRGSSIKGAMRRTGARLLGLSDFLEGWKSDAEEKKLREAIDPGLSNNLDVWLALFGSVDARAALTVHDAWLVPSRVAPLRADVTTVHHPDYYQGSAAPSDTDSPDPIPLLSICAGLTFDFCFQVRGSEWQDFVKQILTVCVSEDGLGAKTNSSYGFFRPVLGPR